MKEPYKELNTTSNLSYKADVSTSSDVFFRTESESTLLREVSFRWKRAGLFFIMSIVQPNSLFKIEGTLQG